ncbi:MAG TPA: ABC-type transport auxiliary lipoprotein family protein [Novosphingobium sp.]|nr:ABC-type transport auxiliary lipoprotein family protein [Novosphingobium sp.]
MHFTRTGRAALISGAMLMLGAGLLGGCVNLGGGKAPPQMITLTPLAPAPAGSAATLSAAPADVLVVAEPEAERALTIPRVAVQVDATGIAYLKDGMWAERPTRLFRDLLAETLRQRGKKLVMEDDEDTPKGAPRLGGRLLALGYDARGHAAVVRFDAVKHLPNGTIATRRFEAREEHISPNARDVAPALNRAANQVVAEVADWAL